MIDALFPSYGVLLVDDEEAWLRSLSMTLAMSGGINNVVRCSDSRQVMDILKQQKIGLVMLDLNMPHLDGREVLKIVKNDPLLKKIPIVILTTSEDDNDIVNTYQNGANSFFTKPMDYEKLVALMGLLKVYWLQTAKLPLENS